MTISIKIIKPGKSFEFEGEVKDSHNAMSDEEKNEILNEIEQLINATMKVRIHIFIK